MDQWYNSPTRRDRKAAACRSWPFATSFAVSDSDVHGAIFLSALGLVIDIVMIAALHFTSHPIARNIAEV